MNHHEQQRDPTEIRAHSTQCSEHSIQEPSWQRGEQALVSLTCSPSTHQTLLHGPSHRGEAPALGRAHTTQGGQGWALPAGGSLRLTGDSRRLGSWKYLHVFLMIWISEKSGLVKTNRLRPWVHPGRGISTIRALYSSQWPAPAGQCVWDRCWQSSLGQEAFQEPRNPECSG